MQQLKGESMMEYYNYCESCHIRWLGDARHECGPSLAEELRGIDASLNAYFLSLLEQTPTPEQNEEAYLRWVREFKPEWLPAAMAEAETEQQEQYESCVKDYLNGVHHQLFDALMKTRSEQSKDVQARRVVEILLSQRKG
jgi:hypothetical protein